MKRIFRMVMVAGIVAASASTAMAVNATGGTVTDVSGYRIHTFTSDGTFTVPSGGGGDIELLVVAGGGGGGRLGGGGGAGGLIYSNVFTVVSSSNYTVTVGGGGAGSTSRAATGGNGTNSVFGPITATGGGGGGSFSAGKNGAPGGSGGGGSYSSGGSGTNSPTGQGYPGGAGSSGSGGGGGGAGAIGISGNANVGGNGGAGKSYDISGTTATNYAGGGGGCGTSPGPGGSGGSGVGGWGDIDNATVGNGMVNTGGGGGGSRDANSGGPNGGNGGSGIVIVRYLIVAGTLPPLIDTLDPTNITTSSAYMNGTLTANGDSAATVRLYWGPSDGVDNPSAWATNITFAGTFSTPSALTTNITGLNSNTLYYYRYCATNAQGVTWASSSKAFINGGVGIQKTSDASEIGLMPGTFTVYRASSATNVALTLTYARTGISATLGVDYAALPMTVTIPLGATNAPIIVTPLANWVNQNATTLELTLTSGVPICLFDATASNATLTIANQPLPYNAPTNIWVAAAAGNASVAGNWSLNHVPTSSETVLLGVYSTKNMTWDSAATNTVAKWVQEAGYTGTVTIATTYSAPFTNLTVLGDVTLNGGAWTHLPNTTTESNRLCVTVGGNLVISNAAITADGKGYVNSGPGWNGGGGSGSGGTYGGVGGDWTNLPYASRNTYGSIFAPTNLGSAGGRGTPGGAVMLTVAGTSTVSGVISCNDDDGSRAQGGCSGGSIYLTTGWLIGNGTIRANGGPGTGSLAAGGGGRVAIILTGTGADFGNWTGTNTAYGWSWVVANTWQRSAAGTVYRAAGGIAAGGGTVIVDNNNYLTNAPYTALPAFSNSVENLTKTPWIAQNGGKIGVVTNATIGSLTMKTNSYLELAGSTLTLTALTITNHVFSAKTYVAADLGALVSDSSGSGKVVVTGLPPRGTLITIR